MNTKDLFANALLVLLKQYTYKEITITQIAQEANLSRKTFYRTFEGKDELLQYIFTSLYKQCESEIVDKKAQHYWDVVQCYFDYWESHKNLLDLLNNSGLLPLFFDNAYQYSFKIFEYIRSKEVSDYLSSELPYLLAYSVGGMHSMLSKWVEDDMKVDSKIIIHRLKKGFKSLQI